MATRSRSLGRARKRRAGLLTSQQEVRPTLALVTTTRAHTQTTHITQAPEGLPCPLSRVLLGSVPDHRLYCAASVPGGPRLHRAGQWLTRIACSHRQRRPGRPTASSRRCTSRRRTRARCGPTAMRGVQSLCSMSTTACSGLSSATSGPPLQPSFALAAQPLARTHATHRTTVLIH